MSAEQIQAVEEKIASQGAPVAEEAPVTPPPAQPSGDETNEELVDTASTEGAEARRNKKSASDRISELYRKTKDSERVAEAAKNEAEYWRQLALKSQPQSAAQPAEGALKTLEDFGWDQEKYLDYKAEQKAEAVLSKREAEQRQKAEKAKIDERDKSFHERIQKFEDEHPEIDFVKEVIEAPIAISEPMADFIKESDVGPEMGVYFKDHATEAKGIFDMSPSQAYRALAKLEIKLSASKPEIPEQPVQITRAPPAPPRLNASSAGRSSSDGVAAEIAALRAKAHR